MNTKAKSLALISSAICLTAHSQTLQKMNWFNEPEHWEISGNILSMDVTPKTDYWRVSHYGFTVDDAPFYYATYGGEFEAKAKISGNYKTRFDQAGMILRIDCENYIKTGLEYVDGKYNIDAIWIKAVRRRDAIEIFYSFDDIEYTLMRNAWMKACCPISVGLFGASPDGDGFRATFSDFKVTHLPDAVRTQWLENNRE